MAERLKVLIAEDSPNDAELMLRELRRIGFEPDWARVDTESDFCRHLTPGLDLIFSDFDMPGFGGLRALELLKASGLDLPFIIISGTIGEETAVDAMKLGASDYLLKGNLVRLEQAVRHALAQTKLRKEHALAVKNLRENESKLRHVFDGIAAFVGLFSADGRILAINEAAMKTTALSRDEILGRRFVDGPWWSGSPEMRARVASAIERASRGETVREELIASVVGGGTISVDAVFNPVRSESGEVLQIVASGTDVTERKNAERKNREQLDELLRWQDVMLNREDRIEALKMEVNELLARQQLPQRYTIPATR